MTHSTSGMAPGGRRPSNTVCTMPAPANREIAATLGRFFNGGEGPRHTDLTSVFNRTGYHDADPLRPGVDVNKETRVREVVIAAERRPARARELVDGLLAEMRSYGCFDGSPESAALTQTAQAAFRRSGWELTDGGELRVAGVAGVMAIEGRPAIEEQLERLHRAADDPALLVGTAKEMLESTAKYVLEQYGMPYPDSIDFDQLWYHARERLGMLPQDIDVSQPGAAQIREVMQSSWSIARQVNALRKVEGTGHGRTLPTGVSPELALLVVREACSVAEFTLGTLDRKFGR